MDLFAFNPLRVLACIYPPKALGYRSASEKRTIRRLYSKYVGLDYRARRINSATKIVSCIRLDHHVFAPAECVVREGTSADLQVIPAACPQRYPRWKDGAAVLDRERERKR